MGGRLNSLKFDANVEVGMGETSLGPAPSWKLDSGSGEAMVTLLPYIKGILKPISPGDPCPQLVEIMVERYSVG